MKKIIDFDNYKKYQLYRESKTKRTLGNGSEGTCYLGNDGFVYKEYFDYFDIDYNPNEVITSDEFSTDAFIFPDILFTVNGRLVGLRTKYIKNNLIDIDLIDDDYLKTFDFDKFLEAYQKMITEVEKLSKAGIRIFDLSSNLIFDGEQLYGIDTCDYKRTKKDISAFNRECLDDAMKSVFRFMDDYLYGKEAIDISLDVESYVRAIEKRYKPDEYSGSGYVKK